MAEIGDNKNVFEAIAPAYIKEESHWGSDLDLIKESIEEIIKSGQKVKWLDIGCGPAFHIASLGEVYPEIKITGIDFSPLMLREAKSRIRKLNLKNVTLKQINIINAKIPKKYNLITFLNNGFGNLYDQRKTPQDVRKAVIRKISNMLSDKGHFILSVYSIKKLDTHYGKNLRLTKTSDMKKGNLFVEFGFKGRNIAYYSHWFSEKELRNIFREANFVVDFLERRMSRFLIRCRK